jgi:hypothetical protein
MWLPGIDLTQLEEYAALRGYGMAYERGAFVFLMAKETGQIHSASRFPEITQNTIAAAMVCAACALGRVLNFKPDTREGDEWKLFQRKGARHERQR